MRRIIYFLITNLAILIVLGSVLKIIGIDSYLTEQGLDYGSLLLFAAVFGMGGSFISLALAKWTAKRLTGASVIIDPGSESEAWLVHTVSNLSREAGIETPEVAVYDAADPNAFATGMRKNNSLVAVSTGLLRRMDKGEVRAVLAHEVAHITNGDMVTLALIQGVVNTFVIFFSRIIGNIIDRVVFKNEEGHGIAFWVTTIIAEIFLAVLASIIVFWFSRRREYQADHGAAVMVGKRPMIGALESLKASIHHPHLSDEMAAFGISGKRKRGLSVLFATHPDLDDRIKALRASSL
ncbi:MAG: protease HtpX [Thermodesulfobacteriota bacterium]|nr:protease HtpX [Thermodesulfobacteriota bacterium]